MSEPAITCPAGADTQGGASRSGDYSISWTGPEGATFRVVETPTGSDAVVVYQGPQTSTSITGRYEGQYAYEVGVVDGTTVQTWSPTCTVLVEPYALSTALMFFGLGLTVTLATALLILRGHRAHRRGELG